MFGRAAVALVCGLSLSFLLCFSCVPVLRWSPLCAAPVAARRTRRLRSPPACKVSSRDWRAGTTPKRNPQEGVCVTCYRTGNRKGREPNKSKPPLGCPYKEGERKRQNPPRSPSCRWCARARGGRHRAGRPLRSGRGACSYAPAPVVASLCRFGFSAPLLAA